MSAKEFWEDDPQLFISYRISFINRKEREMKELDYKCWLQGVYNHNGNSIVLERLKQFIHGMFSRDSYPKIETYPSCPYSEKPIKEKKEQEKENYEKFQKEYVNIGTLKKQYEERLKQKGKENLQNGNK